MIFEKNSRKAGVFDAARYVCQLASDMRKRVSMNMYIFSGPKSLTSGKKANTSTSKSNGSNGLKRMRKIIKMIVEDYLK